MLSLLFFILIIVIFLKKQNKTFFLFFFYRYNLNLKVLNLSFKEGLKLLVEKHNAKAIFMGQRKTDPHAGKLYCFKQEGFNLVHF